MTSMNESSAIQELLYDLKERKQQHQDNKTINNDTRQETYGHQLVSWSKFEHTWQLHLDYEDNRRKLKRSIL